MEVEISGVIASDKSRTTAYLAIVEAIVNSIQSIEEAGRKDGKIVVDLIRSGQVSMDVGENALSPIVSVIISDNGVGFNSKNRKSFGTLFSTHKSNIGGKGYGRIAFLKHFENVIIDSTYEEDGKLSRRKFLFEENFSNTNLNDELIPIDKPEIQTIVKLSDIKRETALDKHLKTVSRKVLELLLPYFFTPNPLFPKIIVRTDNKEYVLNDLVEDIDEITELGREHFELEESNAKKYKFFVVIYKMFYTSHINWISLVAHHREVVCTNLSDYITQFSEPFIENNKSYIIKAYVTGDYFNENVKHHRTGFNFGKSSPTLELSITQNDIEKRVSEIVKSNPKLVDKIETRTQVIRKKISEYVEENPWHKNNMSDLDLNTFKLNPTEQDIELALHKLQYEKERNTKTEVNEILKSTSLAESELVERLVSSITELNKNQLAKYVSHRKLVIDFLKKALQASDDGKYATENVVHNLIYPKNSDSEQCNWDEHNLWLLDERLTFTQYVTSDKKHTVKSKDRSDILIFDKQMVYRTGDDAGNPVTVFELKRPQRFDYLNPGSKEDPVDQILRYCSQLRTNTLTDSKGVTIKVHENTPFYAYIITDINGDVEKWLRLKDFKILPDGGGWYYWHGALNLYVEFIGWERVWKDAEMRNKIFFKQLGIS